MGKVDSTGTFSYTLANDVIDAAVLKDGAATYRQGVGLIGEVRSSTKRYYNADSLGSTRAQADSTGVSVATKETDVFGNVWAPGTAGTSATPFGFAGQHGYQSDADSGLMRLGHRYYDSSTGRFLSRDPSQDGHNWYSYCYSDPLNTIDPAGLFGWRDVKGWWNDLHDLGKTVVKGVGTAIGVYGGAVAGTAIVENLTLNQIDASCTHDMETQLSNWDNVPAHIKGDADTNDHDDAAIDHMHDLINEQRIHGLRAVSATAAEASNGIWGLVQ